MGNFFSSIKTFIEDSNNFDKIIWLIIGVVIGFLVKDLILNNLVKLIKFIFKKLGNFIAFICKHIYRGIKKAIINLHNKIEYRKTIKNIVKGKIPIPPYFLVDKTPEKNPELKIIFKKIANGELEEPKETKLARYLKEHPIDINKIAENNASLLNRRFDLPKFFKNDNRRG